MGLQTFPVIRTEVGTQCDADVGAGPATEPKPCLQFVFLAELGQTLHLCHEVVGLGLGGVSRRSLLLLLANTRTVDRRSHRPFRNE